MNDRNMNALKEISEGELKNTQQILMDKARELLPLIRSNAEKTDRERRTAEENIQAMQAAGLFKMMVPKRYGGHEVDFRTNLEVVSIVAEACGGTSWVLNLISVCAWFAALFPAQAQDEVFGADNDARVAGVFMPSGTLKRVEGGIRVSGKWYYSSGCLHANWGLLGLMELDADGNPMDQYLGLVPMAELEIEDTWYTTGMRGSGSNCLVAKDVFIPAHRMLSLSKAILGEVFSHAQAVLRAKDPQEWLALQSGMMQPLAEKTAAYGQHILTIANSSGAEFGKICEAKMAEIQAAVADAVETFAKSAPAGTEAAMAAFKNALSTSQNVIESAQSSAKKAVETVEANLEEVASQTVNAVGGHGKKR